MDNQPTIQEISDAWTDRINFEDIPGARAAAMVRLLKLRRAKHTWVGAEENKLRFALDDYLRSLGIHP